MTSRADANADLADVLRLAHADWLDDSACRGSGAEFVDVDERQADELARAYCYRCPVIGHCRDLGERLAPHRHPSLFGARWWAKGERP